MARGWESKNVEDQIAGQEQARQARSRPALSPAAQERRSKQDGLKLSRATTLTQLQSACDGRYRALLETTLAHIDDQLARLAAEDEAEGESRG